MLHFDYTLIITLIDEIKLYQISQFSNSILKQDFKENQHSWLDSQRKNRGKLQHFVLMPTRLPGVKKENHGG